MQEKHAKPGQRSRTTCRPTARCSTKTGRVPQATQVPGRPQHGRAAARFTIITGLQARRTDLRHRVRGGTDAEAARRQVQHADLREPFQRLATAGRLSLPCGASWARRTCSSSRSSRSRVSRLRRRRLDADRLPLVGSPQVLPDHPESVVTPWSVDPDEYGYFLAKVWDEWRSRDFGKALVNFCETLVVQHMGLPSQVCIHSEVCGKGVASKRRRRLQLRPLRLSRVSAGQHPRALARRHGLRPCPGEFRLREVRDAAGPTAGNASFFVTAGASARRTACCARRTASRGSTICAPG